MADKIRTAEREMRMKAALRDNLKRRKAAARKPKAKTSATKRPITEADEG